MNETWWLSCIDPVPMCEYLPQGKYGRKRLLFACACCRKVWPLMKDERGRKAVEVCERHADGQASMFELEAARSEARAAIPSKHPSRGVTVGTRPWRDTQTIRHVTLAAWLTASSSRSALSVASTSSIARTSVERRVLMPSGSTTMRSWRSRLPISASSPRFQTASIACSFSAFKNQFGFVTRCSSRNASR
jgi:hypothetical protein